MNTLSEHGMVVSKHRTLSCSNSRR